MLIKCTECRWSYPEEYLHPIISNTGNYKDICGICALDITNKIHGTKRKHFNGEMAEANRQDAIVWRRNHPDKRG